MSERPVRNIKILFGFSSAAVLLLPSISLWRNQMWWWDERPELYSILGWCCMEQMESTKKKKKRTTSVECVTDKKEEEKYKRDTHEREWKRGVGCVGTDRRKHTGSITSTTMDLYKPSPHRRGDLFNLPFLLSRLLFLCPRVTLGARSVLFRFLSILFFLPSSSSSPLWIWAYIFCV